VRDVHRSGDAHAAGGVRDPAVNQRGTILDEVDQFQLADGAYPRCGLPGLHLPPGRVDGDDVGLIWQ